MNMKTIASLLIAGAILVPGAAQAAVKCGDGTGKVATGAPIKVGGIHGNAAPGDFSSATDAAAAYFACLNANGGVHGRPIKYMVENDQWNPELAAQAASKLVQDQGVIAMVDGAVKSCWPMACLYRSLRFGEEYLPVSALLVDKT